MTTCNKCLKSKEVTEFYPSNPRRCKECKKQESLDWRMLNREKWKAQRRIWEKENAVKINARQTALRKQLKQQLIEAYGGSCACCDEQETVFLTLDHIKGDGAEDRRYNQSTSIYRRLRREGWPDGYQILCYNCNWARSNGGCPHGNPAGQPLESVILDI